MVSALSAVRTIRLSSGVRRLVSQMIRTGSRPPGMRQVSRGSSESTVPTPARMPRYRCRISWTCRRAASLVIHREAPV